MNPDRAERWIFLSNFFLIIVLFVLFAFSPTEALAQTNPGCPSVYGVSCPSGQISIDKKVQNPKSGEFVDVLSTTDVTFAPNQEVNFRVEVKNTGSNSLTQVFAQDRFPGNIDFISGPGTFDQNNRVSSWTIDSLGVGESKFFQIKVKVKPQSELQFDIACMTNFVQAQKDQNVAQDTSVFCIQVKPLIISAPKELPATGSPTTTWLLTGLLLPVGLLLRKYASNNKDGENHASYILQTREFVKVKGVKN